MIIREDLVFLGFPNKTIEVPPLGTCLLQSAVRECGFVATQYDYNLLLKDNLFEVNNLTYVHEEVLPVLWSYNLNNPDILNSLEAFSLLLDRVQLRYTLAELCKIKELLQDRNYETVFCDVDNSALFKFFIPLLSHASNFLNLIVSNPEIERCFPDLFIFSQIDELLSRIVQHGVPVIAVSIVEMQRQFSMWAIERLRCNFSYKGKVIIGGSDITYFNEYLSYFPHVDYAIYQEGENAIVKLLKYLNGGLDRLDTIPNLLFRKEEKIIKTDSMIVENFTKLIPDFSGLPLEKYISHGLPIQASRGCSWGKCTYCKHFRTYGKDFYHGCVTALVDQIEFLKERHCTDLFHFVDDDFPPALKCDFADELTGRGIDIKWLAYSRFDKKITKKMLKKWHDAGLLVIEWGLESASEKVLKEVKKGICLDTVKKLLFHAHSLGMLNKVFMFHNLPKEGYDELWTSVSFLRKFILKGIIRPFWEILTQMELLKGTPMYEKNFRDQGKSPVDFKKVFLPRGDLVVQAGYIPIENSAIKEAILVSGLSDIKNMVQRNNILEMNDEAILYDVILEDMRKSGKKLRIHTRISSTSATYKEEEWRGVFDPATQSKPVCMSGVDGGKFS